MTPRNDALRIIDRSEALAGRSLVIDDPAVMVAIADALISATETTNTRPKPGVVGTSPTPSTRTSEERSHES